MPYGLVENPDAFMAAWMPLLSTRHRLRQAYVERGETNVNAWLRLIDDLRIAPYSRLVAFTWFERVRHGEKI